MRDIKSVKIAFQDLKGMNFHKNFKGSVINEGLSFLGTFGRLFAFGGMFQMIFNRSSKDFQLNITVRDFRRTFADRR